MNKPVPTPAIYVYPCTTTIMTPILPSETRETVLCDRCSDIFSSPVLNQVKSAVVQIQRSHSFPSSSERIQFAELLSEVENNLARYQQEISRLHAITAKLERERDELKEYADVYHPCIDAPIRRLPADILIDIFMQQDEFCGDMDSAIAVQRGIAPLNLSRVCRRWRDVTFATKALWSSISVSFGDAADAVDPDDYDDLVPKKLAWLTKRLVDYLDRSGQTPLTLRIKPGHRRYYPNHPFLCALARHSHRWYRLEVTIPKVYFSEGDILATIQGNLPILAELKVPTGFYETGTIFEVCPNLHKVVLGTGIWSSDAGLRIPWNNLSTLEILNITHRGLGLAKLLRECSQLTTLVVSSYNFHIDTPPTSMILSTVVNITITPLSWAKDNSLASFFDALHLPCLESFSIHHTVPVADYWRSPQEPRFWPQNEFISLLRRSQCRLHSVILDNRAMNESQLLDVLRMIPTVVTLQLTCDPIDRDSMITDEVFRALTYFPVPDLLVEPDVFLPNLIRVKLTLGEFIDAEVFCKFVASRWLPDGQHEVACLESVIITDKSEFGLEFQARLQAFRCAGLKIYAQ